MTVKNKFVWLVVSCVMILSLVVASCGAAEEEEAEVEVGEEEVTVTGEAKVEEEVEEEMEEEVSPDKPKYGGTIIEALAFDISNWANGLEFC